MLSIIHSIYAFSFGLSQTIKKTLNKYNRRFKEKFYLLIITINIMEESSGRE